MIGEIILYDYWRSSAAWRVRMALALKGLRWRSVPVDLRQGDQRSDHYRSVNPQGLVPALAINGELLTQSLAIIDYLDASYPEPPLLPRDPAARAKVLAQALVIAADTHPLQNLRVMNHLRAALDADEAATFAWNRHWIGLGFATLEQSAPDAGLFGGDSPNLVDICLLPQMGNARRFELPLDSYPRLL